MKCTGFLSDIASPQRYCFAQTEKCNASQKPLIFAYWYITLLRRSKMAMTAYLRPAGGLALVGLLGWTTAEALNEALVYKHCRRLALEKATANAELSEQLGLPLTSGPWYNASIGLTHRENIANCQLTVVGSKHSSDIYIRVVRTKGPRSTLLYNLVGSANWEVLMMEASISAGGGLSRNISLTDIPEPPKPKDAS